MEFKFIERGNRGRAEYDFETETYSWEYDGDHEEIRGLLEMLDDGPVYDEMDTGPPPDDAPDERPVLPREQYVTAPWDEQLRRLARDLRFYGAQVQFSDEYPPM